ncbi:MAG: hypothetical protein ACTSP4_14650 [Candidatus Hodarchaeales archaeon]
MQAAPAVYVLLSRIVLFWINLDKSCRQSRRGHPMRRDPVFKVFFPVKDPGKKY